MARARTLGEVHQVRSPFEPLLSLLDEAWAVSIAEAIADGLRSRWLERVVAAREDWVSDFGGEQFALGRAFYTHLESEQATRYFHDAAASDATVERHLPGMQAELQRLFAACVGGQARRRLGYCGAGVHIFPAGENVARHGGVIHWDVEGLAPLALERETAALTLVVMAALFPGVLAYLIYGWTQSVLGPGPVAMTMYLGPLYAAVVAWLFVGEALELHHLVGGVLILSGVGLVVAGKRAGD